MKIENQKKDGNVLSNLQKKFIKESLGTDAAKPIKGGVNIIMETAMN